MWIHTSEKQNIQVALYMLNYTKQEIMTDEIRKFLGQWIRDSMEQIECERLCKTDHKEHAFSVEVNPIKR